MATRIYRLRGNYTESRGIQLPLKNQFIEKFIEENNQKISKGYKKIVYIPGSDSIFVEDQKGDLKPKSIWFRFGELRVDEKDHVLIKIMEQHPWNGIKYDLWSEELETERKLEASRARARAIQLIDDSNEDQIKAIALAIFGEKALIWDENKCELKLREEAESDPKTLVNTMSEGGYEAKLIAGMAFAQGVVEQSKAKKAVVWADSDGVIIRLAKGENGVQELGRYLANRTQESEEVIDAITERVDNLFVDGKQSESEKDAYIKELEAKLAKAQKSDEGANKELLDAREAYKEKFNKDVPPNKKNDLDWINNKVSQE